jgi:hypothetical protein
VAGAIVVALLALTVELIMEVVQRVSDPMRRANRTRSGADRDDLVTEGGMKGPRI